VHDPRTGQEIPARGVERFVIAPLRVGDE
jgi:hypothetical protein